MEHPTFAQIVGKTQQRVDEPGRAMPLSLRLWAGDIGRVAEVQEDESRLQPVDMVEEVLERQTVRVLVQRPIPLRIGTWRVVLPGLLKR